jgi:hypothetical protein
MGNASTAFMVGVIRASYNGDAAVTKGTVREVNRQLKKDGLGHLTIEIE